MTPSQKKMFGECFYDQFLEFLGEPSDREVFQQQENLPSIQILIFDNVLDGCRVFCSLGASHYYPELKSVAEVLIATDEAWDIMPTLLANALFFAVQQKMELGRGLAIAGLDKISPEFVKQFKKTALYFTRPTFLPPEFSNFECDGVPLNMYQAFPITKSEYDFFGAHGAEKFEDLLEKGDIDPLEIGRISTI